MSLESGCELAGPSGSLSLPKLRPKCHPGLQPSQGSTGKGFTSKYNCSCFNSWTKGPSISPILIRGPEGTVAAQHASSQQRATRAGQRVGATNRMSVSHLQSSLKVASGHFCHILLIRHKSLHPNPHSREGYYTWA